MWLRVSHISATVVLENRGNSLDGESPPLIFHWFRESASENNLHCQLDDSHVSTQVGNLAKIRLAAEVRVGIGKMRCVRGVEGFQPGLNLEHFLDLEILEHGNVRIHESRASQ
jgi:hypothetical protein